MYMYRYTVKELLQLDFFSEDSGLKVELVKKEAEGDLIQLRLRVVDSKKRKQQHKENEAIQFDYMIGQDNPEEVAQDMVTLVLLSSFCYLHTKGMPKVSSFFYCCLYFFLPIDMELLSNHHFISTAANFVQLLIK